MYLIVGLGNPEEEYANTRHNMGFWVINKLAKQYDIEVKQQKFEGLLGKGSIEGEKVILLKPQTYMNLSGNSVVQCKNYFKIEEEHIIVVYDDMDLNPEQVRIRKKGSPGTHNGIKSVTKMLGTENFPRVRVGIGKNEDNIIDYVIGQIIKEEEKKKLELGTTLAKDAIIEILKNGIDSAMNKFN